MLLLLMMTLILEGRGDKHSQFLVAAPRLLMVTMMTMKDAAVD